MTQNKTKIVTVRLDAETHKKGKLRLAQEGATWQHVLEAMIKLYASGVKTINEPSAKRPTGS